MWFGAPWWLYVVVVAAGSAVGVAVAVLLAAGWGLLLGLVDLWRDRHRRR